MKIKNFYYVITIEENGKYFAFADTIKNSENLKCVLFERNKNAIHINACSSRMEAENIAVEWNNDYKNNGTYMF